ncbi:MAG: glycerol-3-phosphate 1-O-acyltransferase PlsY [Candidatus Omnitrophota bacterium]
MLYFILAICISYLLGSIPTSYIIAKLLKGIDIREHGSGNVGATNLMRTVGRLPGVIGFLLDAGKGAVPVILFAHIFYEPTIAVSEPMFKVAMGLAAVCGHIWTLFLKFKGGKGVATTIGVFIGLAPMISVIGLLVWLAVVLIFRYVSLGSIIMAAVLPFLMVFFNKPNEYIFLSAVLCIFILYSHRPNIRRLLSGKEYKIGQPKK